MTNYTGFINAMLELRNQRLKEAMFKAQQQQEEMAALGKGIGGAIGSIGKGFASNMMNQRENAMLNRVDPPGATAVDPAMQSSYTGGGGSPYTGGVDEFKLRLALQDQRNQNVSSQLAQNRFGYEQAVDQRDYNRQVSRDSVVDANIAADNARQERVAGAAQNNMDVDNAAKKAESASKGLKESFNDMESYHASMKVHENDMRDAPDKYSFDNAARSAHSLWTAAQKRGLDVGDAPPAIAPYLTPTQKQAIAAQQIEAATSLKELQDAKEAQPGMLDWAAGMLPGMQSKDEAVRAAQEKYKMEQGTLESLQRGGSPFDPNAAAPAAGGGIAPGTIRSSPSTKRRQKWDGQQWIDI